MKKPARLLLGTIPVIGLIFFGQALLVFAEASFPKEGKVRRVIDGDTFELENGQRVRLIGVDAPEYQPWKSHADFYGREASVYLKGLLTGQHVRLEPDLETHDKYGRILAYVYLLSGRFVNQQLVEEGYARAKLYRPNRRYDTLLKKAQRQARDSQKGLWKNEPHALRI
jgi:micrococcal nuclease